ncbi:MAG: putative 2OG-Fe(II) oxygenase [Erythrobacter sp.]|uniref:putative 2OG-Fe(II) oxygenase n=1 Tax=Erythrobacter sp. TaxID=1042 RepID=UPI002617197D|nr:putative 2OG-Fe(II) oxygenase [Erythrobacter sp.]MDJ0979847.1 putative 2OG-Fe(II) oxygenase [Erythrobacter sp.]
MAMDNSTRQSAPPTPEALLEAAIRARKEGDLARVARALDGVLKAAPHHPIPLRLRARVALERGEASALGRFDEALRADPGNAELHLGKAQALELSGDRKGARIVAEQIAAQAPGFIAALSFLSSLYLAAGESDFTAPFAAAAAKAPQDPNILAAWINSFAGIERFADAARIADQARAAFPAEPHFALLEALNAGSAGDWDRAEAVFADLALESAQRWLAEARHRLRAGQIAMSQALVDKALDTAPHDVAAWALQGIVWRLSETDEGKAKARWLHEQAGLVQMRPLIAQDGLLERVRTRLEALHEGAGMPLGQSLRGGSQTRGILLQRPEPEFAELHSAILDTLKAYRDELPDKDADHPLLKARDTPWRLAGSWSVRLTGEGDHHAAHIHPAGLISSALYVTVPQTANDADKQGWLEIGRPPADLRLDLAPIASIQPKEGHLALFPSTLYHGTTRFARPPDQSARMTIAFDVITAQQGV